MHFSLVLLPCPLAISPLPSMVQAPCPLFSWLTEHWPSLQLPVFTVTAIAGQHKHFLLQPSDILDHSSSDLVTSDLWPFHCLWPIDSTTSPLSMFFLPFELSLETKTLQVPCKLTHHYFLCSLTTPSHLTPSHKWTGWTQILPNSPIL